MLALMLTFVMRDIKFFKFESGKSPIADFLNSLSGKQAKKITWVLELFAESDLLSGQYLKEAKKY